MQAEYGPFEKKDLIRLAPSKSLFEEIRKNWEERIEVERLEKVCFAANDALDVSLQQLI
jgi:hypothetical protein